MIEADKIIVNAVAGDMLAEKTMLDCILAKGLLIPNGYELKDDNGNVINATMIVLEKKKKDVNLTQEQINAMVHDSCVLFCKHCGCGIPRDTCTSLGTCKEHDEYRTAIRTHLMENKKNEYPKTYEECSKVLGIMGNELLFDATKATTYELKRTQVVAKLYKLLICRDAYWKIAGEEMGLGKPWEPDWNDISDKYCIYFVSGNAWLKECQTRQCIFAFPTEEMRDAFYENFKELIESCKELLQ